MSDAESAARAPAAVHIVVIDDELFTLKLIVHMLARLGYTRVTACDSAPKALQALAREAAAAQLLFLDIHLCGLDGVESIGRLVELGFSGGLVLVSAGDDALQESVERLVARHRLSVVGRLAKPIAPKDLSGLLAQLNFGPGATPR